MKIAIGCDHAGYEVKEKVKQKKWRPIIKEKGRKAIQEKMITKDLGLMNRQKWRHKTINKSLLKL